MYLQQSQVDLTGNTIFQSNAAQGTGGAVMLSSWNLPSTVRINGTLCAQNNSGVTAGFAFVDSGSQLAFLEPATANLANNTITAIAARDSSSNITAGVDTWPTPGEYQITGAVGNCSASFAANTSTTCDACGSDNPWDSAKCSCKVSPAAASACGLICTMSQRQGAVWRPHCTFPPRVCERLSGTDASPRCSHSNEETGLPHMVPLSKARCGCTTVGGRLRATSNDPPFPSQTTLSVRPRRIC